MSLSINKPIFIQKLKALFKNKGLDEDQFAEKLGGLIADHIGSATVSTTITGVAPSGPVTGAGQGSLL